MKRKLFLLLISISFLSLISNYEYIVDFLYFFLKKVGDVTASSLQVSSGSEPFSTLATRCRCQGLPRHFGAQKFGALAIGNSSPLGPRDLSEQHLRGSKALQTHLLSHTFVAYIRSLLPVFFSQRKHILILLITTTASKSLIHLLLTPSKEIATATLSSSPPSQTDEVHTLSRD